MYLRYLANKLGQLLGSVVCCYKQIETKKVLYTTVSLLLVANNVVRESRLYSKAHTR